METRPIKELLELHLEEHINGKWPGLCESAMRLFYREISNKEYHKIMDYMKNNQPWFRLRCDGFWWTPYRFSPRISWLEKHIRKNTKK